MNDILIDLKTENNFAFGKLYAHNFQRISKFVQNNSGNPSDAEDLFQDAMMVLLEKLRQDNFELTASIDTYVYAICKNLWFKKLRNKSHALSLDDLQSADCINSINDSIESETSYIEKVKGYLVKMTNHCNRLIQDMFFKEKALEQIQQEYGYSSRHNAQNQKHKCVEQMRKVKEKEENSKKVF